MQSFKRYRRMAIPLFFCVFSGFLQAETRIVSAGGSVTEILFALGLAEHVVAVDTSSLYPEQAQALPKIGYYRQLSPEGVLAQQPSVLVGHQHMGPANVIKQIRHTGVEVVSVPHSYSVESLYQLITALATRFERPQQGQALVTHIQQQLAELEALPQQQVTAAFMVSVGERGLMAAGSDSMPHALFTLAGFSNAFAALSGYQPVSVEALLASSPEWLLVPSHAAGGQSVAQLCALPSLKHWAANNGCRVKIVDPLIFMGLSPRLVEGVRLLHTLSVNEVNTHVARHHVS